MLILPTELQAFEVVDKLRAAGLSSAKWRVLGQRLTPKDDLEAIRADHPTSSKECLEKVVDAFLRNGGDVSWEALAKAVAQCEGGGRNVARKLLTSVGIGIFITLGLCLFFTFSYHCCRSR